MRFDCIIIDLIQKTNGLLCLELRAILAVNDFILQAFWKLHYDSFALFVTFLFTPSSINVQMKCD
jgi:hypothetical protein